MRTAAEGRRPRVEHLVERRRMRVAFLLMPAAMLVATGCVQVTGGPGPCGVGVVTATGVRWAWCDWNLLRQPALFFERIEHRPPPADRVRHFRWQHGAGADDPLLRPTVAFGYPQPETEIIVGPVMEPMVEPAREPEIETVPVPPPAPDDAAIPTVPAPLEIAPEP
jgi:hypothetical protein